jgi:hypothetical protein
VKLPQQQQQQQIAAVSALATSATSVPVLAKAVEEAAAAIDTSYNQLECITEVSARQWASSSFENVWLKQVWLVVKVWLQMSDCL